MLSATFLKDCNGCKSTVIAIGKWNNSIHPLTCTVEIITIPFPTWAVSIFTILWCENQSSLTPIYFYIKFCETTISRWILNLRFFLLVLRFAELLTVQILRYNLPFIEMDIAWRLARSPKYIHSSQIEK